MAEYGVVLAVITIAVFGALTLLSGNIEGAISRVAGYITELKVRHGGRALRRPKSPFLLRPYLHRTESLHVGNSPLMNHRRKRIQFRAQNGQTMTEFALVLPLLALLLFGVIQFGIVFNNYITLTDAVRAGARSAVARHLPDGRKRRHSCACGGD